MDWSTSEQLVYSSSLQSNADLRVYDALSETITHVTQWPLTEAEPTWTPLWRPDFYSL